MHERLYALKLKYIRPRLFLEITLLLGFIVAKNPSCKLLYPLA